MSDCEFWKVYGVNAMLLHLKWTTDYDDIYEELKVQSKDHLIHQPPVKK